MAHTTVLVIIGAGLAELIPNVLHVPVLTEVPQLYSACTCCTRQFYSTVYF